MYRYLFPSVYTLLLVLAPQFLHAQSLNKLLDQAQSSFISGRYELAVHNLYNATAKNGKHKKVLAAANTIIPGIFETLENGADEMKIKMKLSDSSQEKYTFQKEIISIYDQLSKYASKLKYSETAQLLSGHAANFLSKNYKEKYLEAVAAMDNIENNKLDEHYQNGLRLMNEGLSKYTQAEQEFSEILELNPNYKDVKSKMAQICYDQGVSLMSRSNREDFKRAFNLFKESRQYIPGFKDVLTLQEEAKKAATIRIAVFPFNNNSGIDQVGAIGDIQSDNIVSSIFDSEFVEIISRDEINLIVREQQLSTSGLVDESSASNVGKILGVSHVLTGKINQIILNPAKTVSSKYENTQTVYVDAEGNVSTAGALGNLANALLGGDGEVYKEKKVKATVKKYKKIASAKLSCSYKLTDIETGKVINSNAFTTESNFQYEWATFSGDKHGLSKESKKLTEKTEKIAPSPVDMVNECAEESAKRIAKDIYSFLK